jgi:hypothetical protein
MVNKPLLLPLTMCLAAFLAGSGVCFCQGIHTYEIDLNLNDHDTLLPAYFTSDIENGLTGTIRLKIEFEKERVVSVSILSMDLRSETPYAERYPSLVKLTTERIIGTIKKWDSAIVSPFSTELTIELALDPSLPPNGRTYTIENGPNGEIIKMKISGPLLDKLKKYRLGRRVQ